MSKPEHEAIDRLIDIVKQAIEDGRASVSEIEQWLVAAIALEELALEDERQADMADLDLMSWTSLTLH